MGKWLNVVLGVKKLTRSSSSDNILENGRASSADKSKRWTRFKHSLAEKRGKRSVKQDSESGSDQACTSSPDVSKKNGRVECVTPITREERAAIRIQTAFRGFLSRRALKALRGLVKLQALVRGHQVRRQAAMTLRCMQALVRVQARVRARRVRMSEEGLAVQHKVNERRLLEARLRESENGWCNSYGTVEELHARLQQKQEGAIKRDRAMAYALAHQWRPSGQLDAMMREYEPDKSHWGWTWLERWMAAKPWENRSKVSLNKDCESTSLRSYDEMELRKALERSQVKVRRNKVSTRIVPPRCVYSGPITSNQGQRSSAFTLDLPQDASSPSSSSRDNTPPTSCGYASRQSNLQSHSSTSTDLQRISNGIQHTPGYMASTQSAKAKCRVPQRVKPLFDDLNLKICSLSECDGQV